MTRATVWVMFTLLIALTWVSLLGKSLEAAEETAVASGPASIRLSLQSTGVDYTRSVAYDETSQSLYVAADNAILIFGPDGQSKGSIPLDSPAYLLAASGDGRYVYVSLAERTEMARYNVAAQAFDLRWILSAPQGTPCDQMVPDDMLVPEGRPEQLVVTLIGNCSHGTVVYQNGRALPQWVPPMSNEGLINLEPGGAPDVIYGGNYQGLFAALALSDEGITMTLSADVELGDDFRYDRDWLFGEFGVAVDTATFSRQGKYGEFIHNAVVAPDPVRNEVYYVIERYVDEFYEDHLFFLIFERDTFRLLAEAEIPFDYERTPYTGPHDLIQIDPNTFFLAGDTGLHRITVSRFDQYAHVPVVNSTYCGAVLDDFSRRDMGWPVGAQPGGSTAFVGEEYSLRPDGESTLEVHSPFCKRREYEVAVDIRWVSTPGAVYGLRLPLRDSGSQDAARYVKINSAVQGWKIDEHDPAIWEDYLYQEDYWDLEPAIRPDNGVNRLRIVYEGIYWSIYINEVLVSDFSSIAYPHLTNASLFAYSFDSDPESEVEARFDNFMMRNHLVPVARLQSTNSPLASTVQRR